MVFQVVVKGTNGSVVVNSTLSADANDMTLTVTQQSQLYIIQIAAENPVGLGPYSQPLEVEFDPVILVPEVVNNPVTTGFEPRSPQEEETRKQVWIIGAISAAIFVLILISAIIWYQRKLRSRQKPLGYLAASTTDDIHCQLSRPSGPILKENNSDKRHSKDTSLWIDRRWGSDSCEKDSNSSEKKLLQNTQNSNSDTEYAYVENNKHNISSFTNSSGSRKAAESPEPYATTDIFQRHFNQYRNVHSCDDLSHGPSNGRSQHYHVSQQYAPPHNYQRSHNNNNSRRGQPRNLLDMIPPPPVHPPPPAMSAHHGGSIYNKSQESVISPKYLFAHPVYQQSNGTNYKVHPVSSQHPRSHYEQIDHGRLARLPNGQPRLVFDRDCHDELEDFNAMLTQFHGKNHGNNGKFCHGNTSRTVKSDQMSLNCEADNECEDEEDEASSLTHKSDHY